MRAREPSAGVTYRVRQADASAVERLLMTVWASALKQRGDPRDKLRWYHASPDGPTTAFLLEAERGGEVACVGSGCVRAREVSALGALRRAALFADLAVRKEDRTARPVLTLQRAIRQYTLRHFDFAYGFPNRSAVGVYRRLGYHDLGPFAIHVRVLRHSAYLRRVVRVPAVAWAAGALLDAVASPRHRVARAGPPETLAWLDDFDDRFDALWRAAREAHPLLGDRTARFLQWRFQERPGVHCEIAALTERTSSRLRGYAIVRPDEHGSGRVQILDMLGRTEADLDSLLGLLARDLRKAGATAVSVRFFGSGRVAGLLAAHGFRTRDHDRPVWVVVDPGNVPSAETAMLLDRDRWYLTAADRDN